MTKHMEEYEAEQLFRDAFEDVEVTIFGYIHTALRALKGVDGIAYREMFLNWMDAEGITIT